MIYKIQNKLHRNIRTFKLLEKTPWTTYFRDLPTRPLDPGPLSETWARNPYEEEVQVRSEACKNEIMSLYVHITIIQTTSKERREG